MQYYRKTLERAVNKLYKLRTERVDAGDCRNRRNLIFADKLARKHASGKREVLAELFNEDRELAGGRQLIAVCIVRRQVGGCICERDFSLQLPRLVFVPCRFERQVQQRFFCYHVAHPERAERFAHLVLFRDGKTFKAGKDQRLSRLGDCRDLCDRLFFFLPCNGHMFLGIKIPFLIKGWSSTVSAGALWH